MPLTRPSTKGRWGEIKATHRFFYWSSKLKRIKENAYALLDKKIQASGIGNFRRFSGKVIVLILFRKSVKLGDLVIRGENFIVSSHDMIFANK